MKLTGTQSEFTHDSVILDRKELDARPMRRSRTNSNSKKKVLADLKDDPFAIQAFLKTTGICATCERLAYCAIRTEGRPVNFYCEEFK